MTPSEQRRAALNQNSTAKNVWTAILVLQGIGGVIILLLALGVAAIGAAAGSGLVAGITGFVTILTLGIVALIMWGVWKLERWVLWLMWINVILGLPSLFSRSFYSAIISILVAVGYTWVLRVVSAPTPTAPQAPTVPPTQQ